MCEEWKVGQERTLMTLRGVELEEALDMTGAKSRRPVNLRIE